MEKTVEQLAAEVQDNMKKSLEGKVDKTELTELKGMIEKAASRDELEEISKAIGVLTDNVKNIKIERVDTKVKSIGDLLFEKKDEYLSKIKSGQTGYTNIGSIRTKVAGTITEGGHISGTGNYPLPMLEPGIYGLPENLLNIRQYADVAGTTSNLIQWVQKQNRDGGAGQTSENTLKTQSDFDLVNAQIGVVKTTSFMKIVKEMLTDIPAIEAEIRSELMYLIANQEQDGLYHGNGTPPNIYGVTNACQTLDFAGIQNKFAAGTAYWYDVILGAITQIRYNMKSLAAANVCYVSIADHFLLLANMKNTQVNYVLPFWVTMNNGVINVMGVPVVPADFMTNGYYLVGDFKKFHIRDLEDISLSIGLDTDDFTNNRVTILGERRGNAYVKSNDFEAFIRDTFTNGIAWLEA